MKGEKLEVNRVHVKEGNTRVVMSIDIINMYPSIDKDVAKKEIYQLIMESNIVIKF